MSVRKINGSWWIDFRFHRKRYRRKSPATTKTEATTYETILRGKLLNNEPIDPEPEETPQSFKEFAWEWFESYVKSNNKPSEIDTKKSTLSRHLIPYFGNMPINNIPPRSIEKFKSEKLNTGLAKKSINNLLAVLGKCLRTAAEWEQLNKVPKIELFKCPPSKYDFLSHKEAE
jgi:hypothetical protein